MNILIDILHPAHLNFFKHAILKLREKYNVSILIRPRGDLLDFAQHELPGLDFVVLGRHYKSRIGKLWGLLQRVIQVSIVIQQKSIDVVTSHGGFYAAISARIFKKKSVIFYDNSEYRVLFKLCEIFSTRFVIPKALGISGKNICTYDGYKEAAYLKDFVADDTILAEFGVSPKKFIVLRQIANISLDYWSSDGNRLLEGVLKYMRHTGIKVIVSREQGAMHLPILDNSPNVLFIKRPTSKLHSLIYHALFTISTGDTVSRESAILGVPSLFLGNKEMSINREFERAGLIVRPGSYEEAIRAIENLRFKQASNHQGRSKIYIENITAVMIEHIENLLKEK